MDQRNIRGRAKAGESGGAVAIGAVGGVGVAFGLVDGRIGGGVDDQPWPNRLEDGGDAVRMIEIEVGPAD